MSFCAYFTFSLFAALYDPAGTLVKNEYCCLGSGCFFRPFFRRYLEEPAYGMWAHADALPPSRLVGAFRPTTPVNPSEAVVELLQLESSIVVQAHLHVSKETSCARRGCMAKNTSELHSFGSLMVRPLSEQKTKT